MCVVIRYIFITTFVSRLSLADLVYAAVMDSHLLSLAMEKQTSQLRRERKIWPAQGWSIRVVMLWWLGYTHPSGRCRLRCVGEACCFPLLEAMARRILECELGDAVVRSLLAANTGAKTANSRKLG